MRGSRAEMLILLFTCAERAARLNGDHPGDLGPFSSYTSVCGGNDLSAGFSGAATNID